MVSTVKSPSGISLRSAPYDNFQGLDVSRDVTSLDTGKNQHLSTCDNAFCDWRGQIVRDPGADFISGEHPVVDLAFYSSENVVYAEQDGAGVNLVSEAEHEKQVLLRLGPSVTNVVFNRSVHFFSRGQQSIYYNGTRYVSNGSPDLNKLRPSFATSVARRLCVAGVPGRGNANLSVPRGQRRNLSGDEPLDSDSVLRAGVIDVANQLGHQKSSQVSLSLSSRVWLCLPTTGSGLSHRRKH